MAYPKKNPLSFQLNLAKFNDATEMEKAATVTMRKPSTFFKDGVKRLKKNPIAMISFWFLVIVVLSVIFIPIFWPYKYDQLLGLTAGQSTDASYQNLAPFQYGTTEQALRASGQFVFPHLFGTDDHGRDFFIRVIYGTRISLIVGFFASIIVLVIGSIYGSISGFLGGKVDLIMMRIVDIIYSIPDMLIIILLSTILQKTLSFPTGSFLANVGTSMISIFIVFGLLYWVGMARLVRGQILALKKEDFVMAARASGAKPLWIIRKHMLPNSMSVIIVAVALQIPSAIFTESFLSFIGMGVKIPTPSLGALANEGREVMQSYSYRLLIPALMICFIVLALNLLGDGLRDAFDPKLQK